VLSKGFEKKMTGWLHTCHVTKLAAVWKLLLVFIHPNTMLRAGRSSGWRNVTFLVDGCACLDRVIHRIRIHHIVALSEEPLLLRCRRGHLWSGNRGTNACWVQTLHDERCNVGAFVRRVKLKPCKQSAHIILGY
jgi:hypothetical protein